MDDKKSIKDVCAILALRSSLIGKEIPLIGLEEFCEKVKTGRFGGQMVSKVVSVIKKLLVSKVKPTDIDLIANPLWQKPGTIVVAAMEYKKLLNDIWAAGDVQELKICIVGLFSIWCWYPFMAGEEDMNLLYSRSLEKNLFSANGLKELLQ